MIVTVHHGILHEFTFPLTLFDLDANNNDEIFVIDSVNVVITPDQVVSGAKDHSQCTKIDNVDAAYLGKYVAVLYDCMKESHTLVW